MWSSKDKLKPLSGELHCHDAQQCDSMSSGQGGQWLLSLHTLLTQDLMHHQLRLEEKESSAFN